MTRLSFLRRRSVQAGIVAVLLVAVLLLGGRSVWRLGARLIAGPPPPRQTDVSQIADWMSVPYIARAYRVPGPALYEAMGIVDEGPQQRQSLRELAQKSGRDSTELVGIVRETVRAWQASHPEPPGPPGKRDERKPDASPKPKDMAALTVRATIRG